MVSFLITYKLKVLHLIYRTALGQDKLVIERVERGSLEIQRYVQPLINKEKSPKQLHKISRNHVNTVKNHTTHEKNE